jgi:hypothetical protein
MEEHVVNRAHAAVRNLQQNREELRTLLMPRGPDMHIPPGHFPRSNVMRFLLDPRRRKLGMVVMGALMLVMRRRGGAKGGLGWLQFLQPFLAARM